MDVFFINLASQGERRAFLERNFAASDTASWPLHRIEAVTAADAAQVPGALRDGEKACFLSHRKALEAAVRTDGHVLIAEDDIQFGQHTAAALETALKQIPENAWDVVFTDVIFPGLDRMYQLFRLRQDYDASGQSGLLDLSEMNFAGSIGYVVNSNAKGGLLHAANQDPSLDVPYDVWLKHLAQNRMLRAFVIFPFPTTQSELGTQSQIQIAAEKDIGAIWTAFRQLVWRERDIDQAIRALERANTQAAPDCAAMAKIFALMLSPEFKDK